MVLKTMSNNNFHPHKLAKNKCVWCEFTHRLCLESRLKELHLTCGSARSCGAGAGDGGGALLVVWASTTAHSGGVPRHGPLLRAPRPTVLLKQTNKRKKTSEKNKEDRPEMQKVADKKNASKNEKNDVLHVRTQTSCSERTALPTLDLSLCNTGEPWGSEGGSDVYLMRPWLWIWRWGSLLMATEVGLALKWFEDVKASGWAAQLRNKRQDDRMTNGF